MGWFNEQIRQRIQADDDAFQDAFACMASVVMGSRAQQSFKNGSQETKNAVEEILKYYRVNSGELPDDIIDINEQLEYLLRPSCIMRRTVSLQDDWYKNAIGAYLGIKKDGGVVALLPNGYSGYSYMDNDSGKKVKITRKTAALLETEAICFYKPLPLKKLGIKDLLVYIMQAISMKDILLVAISALGATIVGMLLPKINNIIFSDIIQNNDMQLFWAISIMLISVTVSKILIDLVCTIFKLRLQTKTDTSIQAAAMMRVLSLPTAFFSKYSAGELSNRTQSINSLCDMLISAVLGAGLTSVFSLLYIAQVFVYAPTLVVPAMSITLATILFSIASAIVQMKLSKQTMELDAKEEGITYSFISSVNKLKLSGSEKRAFSKWSEIYSKKAKLLYDPPTFIKINKVIATGITLVGTIVTYYIAICSNVSVADFFAFNVAYGMVSGAFLSLSSFALTIANIRPVFEMVAPILQAVPEISLSKKVLTHVSGMIELNNVSFQYSEGSPMIANNLSLKIKSGQYVALVGKTGCGKSTLMRLLLGFEAPQKGAIYYDGKDLNSIDLKSLRRKIGVVMQNSTLFSGDVFSNITISAPWLSRDEAWEAAELAGIAQDIREMPMGMSTLISEGSGGISGGQRQRMIIARAIAPRPKILMFDEATSALDNITQKTVTHSIAGLKCTRIVIAHRLSTIKECDRILVLDDGKIIEDGSYDELLAQNGHFAELVARQRADDIGYIGETTLF